MMSAAAVQLKMHNDKPDALSSIVFYRSYFEAMQGQDEHSRLVFYEAVMKYLFYGIEPKKKDTPPEVWSALVIAEQNMKRSRSRALAGKKGGRASGKVRAEKAAMACQYGEDLFSSAQQSEDSRPEPSLTAQQPDEQVQEAADTQTETPDAASPVLEQPPLPDESPASAPAPVSAAAEAAPAQLPADDGQNPETQQSSGGDDVTEETPSQPLETESRPAEKPKVRVVVSVPDGIPPDKADAISYLESRGITLTRSGYMELASIMNQMEPACVKLAVDTAIKARRDDGNPNPPKWSFVRSILRTRMEKGVRTAAEWVSAENVYQRAAQNSSKKDMYAAGWAQRPVKGRSFPNALTS